MTVFVDTSVVMYAAGAEHEHRSACRQVLSRIADGDLDAVVSTEVVQEILHRFARGRREIGESMARGVVDLFGELVSIDHETVVGAMAYYAAHPALSARDALHVATCRQHGIDQIVSVDEGFDAVPEVRRVPPADVGGGDG